MRLSRGHYREQMILLSSKGEREGERGVIIMGIGHWFSNPGRYGQQMPVGFSKFLKGRGRGKGIIIGA